MFELNLGDGRLSYMVSSFRSTSPGLPELLRCTVSCISPFRRFLQVNVFRCICSLLTTGQRNLLRTAEPLLELAVLGLGAFLRVLVDRWRYAFCFCRLYAVTLTWLTLRAG